MNAPQNPTHLQPDPQTLEDWQHWHRERLRVLQAPDGWLTLAGLVWLEDGVHSVGSADGCAIQLPGAGRCPPRWGSLRIAGKSAFWRPEGGTEVPLQTDHPGPATVVQQGDVGFHLLERNDALALRVKDAQAETRTGFRGTELFAFDPSLQIAAHWDGALAHCEIGGRRHALRPQNAAANPLHFVIGDATTGQQTYGGGRFLFVPAPAGGTGPITLDLNRAINPPCAFTQFALCPVPPPENRMDVPVLAGEKTYAAHP